MHAPLNVGLIGAGRIGQVHAQTLAYGIPQARLAGIADVNAALAEATATRLGCPHWTADALALIADPQVDAVVIASPNETHAPLIIAAAQAGKPIFCEKPIDRALAETDRALAAVAAAGVPLQLGFQRRYDPAHLRTHELAEAGRLGPLLFVHSHTRDPEPPSGVLMAGSGGVFRDTCVHDFDAIRWITGSEIVGISAMASVTPEGDFQSHGEPDIAAITLHCANGVLGTIDAVRGVRYGYDVRTEVIGAAGTVMGGFARETPVIEYRPDGVVHDHVFWFPQRFGQAYADELRAWVANIRAGQPVTPDGVDGRQALVIALAAEESVRQGGQTIAVPPPARPTVAPA